MTAKLVNGRLRAHAAEVQQGAMGVWGAAGTSTMAKFTHLLGGKLVSQASSGHSP
jgi:hypothetical protein